LLCCLSQL